MLFYIRAGVPGFEVSGRRGDAKKNSRTRASPEWEGCVLRRQMLGDGPIYQRGLAAPLAHWRWKGEDYVSILAKYLRYPEFAEQLVRETEDFVLVGGESKNKDRAVPRSASMGGPSSNWGKWNGLIQTKIRLMARSGVFVSSSKSATPSSCSQSSPSVDTDARVIKSPLLKLIMHNNKEKTNTHLGIPLLRSTPTPLLNLKGPVSNSTTSSSSLATSSCSSTTISSTSNTTTGSCAERSNKNSITLSTAQQEILQKYEDMSAIELCEELESLFVAPPTIPSVKSSSPSDGHRTWFMPCACSRNLRRNIKSSIVKKSCL